MITPLKTNMALENEGPLAKEIPVENHNFLGPTAGNHNSRQNLGPLLKV